LEADIKRLFTNAKSYYNKSTGMYADAERIRKILSDFMRKNNPDYLRDPNHITQPTPVSDEHSNSRQAAAIPVRIPAHTVSAAVETPSGRGRRTIVNTSPAMNGKSSTPAASRNFRKKSPNAYEGLTFQQAQEKVVEEVMEATDSE
jgi:hypothetical protein